MQYTMNDFSLYNNRMKIYVLIFFIFPLGMSFVKSWTSVTFYLLFFLLLTSVGCFWRTWSSVDRTFFFSFAAMFVACVLSLVNAADFTEGYQRLEKLYGFLLFVPLAVGLLKARVSPVEPYLKGLAVAGVLMAVVAYVAVELKGLPRARGAYHPIVFGDLAILIAMVQVACLCQRVGTKWWRVLHGVSIAGAVYAAVLSGTRGVWPAVALAGLLLVVLHWGYFTRWKMVVALLLVLGALVASPMLFSDTIGLQLRDTMQSVVSFADGTEKNTSLGQRFLMWEISLNIWQENPFFGTGIGDYRHEIRNMIESGDTPLDREYDHSHNIFIDFLATTGIVGLLSMVFAVFLVPFVFFYKKWLSMRDSDQAILPISGLVTIVCYFCFGMSEGWLSRSVFVIVYVMTLLVFYVGINRYDDHI